MATRTSYHFGTQFFIGLLVIFLGIVFTLDNLNVIYAHDILRFWPVFLVLYGLAKLASPAQHGKVFGLIVFLFGIGLLLHSFGVIEFRMRDWWPLILIVFGVSMLMKTRSRHHVFHNHRVVVDAEPESFIHLVAVMSGYERKNNSQDFRGGEITAIMGGCELDLRSASINDGEAIIDVFAFWGGINIKVPEDWIIILRGTPIMGGIEDTTRPIKEETKKRLVVTGTVIMGGVEISNV
jgi:predicted membrane protein